MQPRIFLLASLVSLAACASRTPLTTRVILPEQSDARAADSGAGHAQTAQLSDVDAVAIQADEVPPQPRLARPDPSTAAPAGPDGSCHGAPGTSACADRSIFVLNARLIDGVSRDARADVDLEIRAGRIVRVAKDMQPAPGAQVYDLGGQTVLPGLIDSHVHLTGAPAGGHARSVYRRITESTADQALRSVTHAKATLAAGFTTVRNVGGGPADRSLRDAINAGYVPGPRMLIAHHSIGITGGHCDGSTEYHSELAAHAPDPTQGVADGVDEVRRAVRHQVKLGADVIKICATGGVMSQGRASQAAQLNDEELQTVVEEARRSGVKVAAHAHGNAGIRAAVAAGVDSIEHGTFLDAAVARMMARRGTVLVPTMYVGQWVLAQADAGRLSPVTARKAREVAPRMRTSFQLALKHGVPIAFGTDAGVFMHGENAKEFQLMVEAGMTPMQAIVSATSKAAELLGIDDEVGRLAVGYAADLVVVEGDPLADIRVLEAPAFVMKAGAWASEQRPASVSGSGAGERVSQASRAGKIVY